MLATAFALLISFSISVALLSWAAPTTAQSISTDLERERSIDGWQLRPTRTSSETGEPDMGLHASEGAARADHCPCGSATINRLPR